MIVGSLLVAAAVSFQSPAHSTPLDVGTAAEAAAAVAATKGHDSATKIAELEKGFWICDYLGTTRGIEGPYGVACGANYEELKQTKFGGDFEELVSGGGSTRSRNTSAGVRRLRAVLSTQSIGAIR